MTSQKPCLVIAGPSGVGKGTLLNMLMAEFPNDFGFSCSHTTRKPREGEVEGVHYHFVELEQMKKETSEGLFVEFANVHGNLYGTSKAAVQKVTSSGKTCLLDIDVQGCKQVKTSGVPAKFIFIAPPSIQELEKRLRGRGTEKEEAIQTRLKNAQTELEFSKTEGFFDKIIVNDKLEDAFKEFKIFVGK